ncbi:peptide-methionine (R)-S-oxide reductase MsrB [Candidatus Kaiserbacteria bacterium]|jgi:peptide-methionine (R)-S-oxide reductase|nr:peptide-methionine (R)-S-oxide reductase MsrB [Candidatus Kaiserbacteria bacterium]
MNDDHLTKEQKSVLHDRATEAPFTGKYLDNKEVGMYNCANCNAMLFSSDTKFDSGSGWPSFDEAVPGAVKEVTDTSHGMTRVEAVCAACGGHLGHIFNDGPKETTGMRYCINSLSLDFDKKKEGNND